MATLKSWWNYLEQVFAYASFCIQQPIQAPVCQPFWRWTMIASLALGGLVALVLLWKLISYQLKLAAARKAQAERERVDHDAIAQARWDGDKAFSGELTAEEIERRVREAVNDKRLADARNNDRMNIV
jgi:hypothetical protein